MILLTDLSVFMIMPKEPAFEVRFSGNGLKEESTFIRFVITEIFSDMLRRAMCDDIVDRITMFREIQCAPFQF